MNSTRKTFIIYPLIFILALSGVFIAGTDVTYAAQSIVAYQGTRWVQGENINSGLRIKTKDGTVVYCLTQGRKEASGSYTDKLSLSSKRKAVLYLGYPNNKKFGNISLTSDQARCATQLALWAHDDSGKGNKINLNKLHGSYDKKPDGDNVLKAAKWIYSKANSGYKTPSKPSFATPKISKPSNSTPQFFNESYVRVGPYKYTTTSNSYTSGNKVSVNLGGAPSGSKIGDSSGNFISTPTSGKDFYVYMPLSKLGSHGTGKINVSVSYNYKYEKAPTFEAYEKSGTQDVAVSVKKAYTSGTKSAKTDGDLKWTNGKFTKVDSKDKDKVIADTEFEVYCDPTPSDTSNDDWKFMYDKKTDENGLMNLPGLGTGTYMLKETKPNPAYAAPEESGKDSKIIFKITDVSTEYVQVIGNDAIDISCQVDEDTIKEVMSVDDSANDQGAPPQTKYQDYKYHVAYRSTSNVYADEFTVDDSLIGADESKINVTELWTPVCYGDYDGKMNLWYKTNKTDDNTDYSNASALSSNPQNPNNPNKESVKANTGFKLWAEGISTTESRHLLVSDLGLDEGEYITEIRMEHGRVEKGFTNRNFAYNSLNDDSKVDWTPNKNDSFYTEGSENAEGLMPLTYLVTCTDQLTAPNEIDDSATSFIARNVSLTDDDTDDVVTILNEIPDIIPPDVNPPDVNPPDDTPSDEVPSDTGGNDQPKPTVLPSHAKPVQVNPVHIKTSDALEFFGLIIVLSGISFVAFMFLTRVKRKSGKAR